jgi:hypothetical protein
MPVEDRRLWALVGAALPVVLHVSYVDKLFRIVIELVWSRIEQISPPGAVIPIPREALKLSVALENAYARWKFVGAIFIGALVGLIIGWVAWGVPESDGKRFDQYTVSSPNYVMGISVPIGARTYQTVDIRVDLRDQLTGVAYRQTKPRLVVPGGSGEVNLIESIEGWLWNIKEDAGSYKVSIDFGAPLFQQPAQTVAVETPSGKSIQNMARRIELVPNGAVIEVLVRSALGLTVWQANLFGAIGAIVGFAGGLLSLFQHFQKQGT